MCLLKTQCPSFEHQVCSSLSRLGNIAIPHSTLQSSVAKTIPWQASKTSPIYAAMQAPRVVDTQLRTFIRFKASTKGSVFRKKVSVSKRGQYLTSLTDTSVTVAQGDVALNAKNYLFEKVFAPDSQQVWVRCTLLIKQQVLTFGPNLINRLWWLHLSATISLGNDDG